jgi:hypothetical protein
LTGAVPSGCPATLGGVVGAVAGQEWQPPRDASEGTGDKVQDPANRAGGLIFAEHDELVETKPKGTQFRRGAYARAGDVMDSFKAGAKGIEAGIVKPKPTDQLTSTPGVPRLPRLKDQVLRTSQWASRRV